MMRTSPRAAGTTGTWRLWVAPVVWAMHFLAIYAFTALACERAGTAGGISISVVPWFVGAATLVAAIVLLGMVVLAVRDMRATATPGEPRPFTAWLTAAISGLVLLAVLWETLPVLMVPACA